MVPYLHFPGLAIRGPNHISRPHASVFILSTSIPLHTITIGEKSSTWSQKLSVISLT